MCAELLGVISSGAVEVAAAAVPGARRHGDRRRWREGEGRSDGREGRVAATEGEVGGSTRDGRRGKGRGRNGEEKRVDNGR